MQITSLGNGKIAVDTPYNPDFVSRIKKAGARWNPERKTWDLDERSAETVRSIMRAVYGQDDTPQELVNVRVFLTQDLYCGQGPCTLFGRVIASARGRDSGTRIGEGIVFEQGCANSGGSVKNWATIIKSGSVVTIYDVPRKAVEERIDFFKEGSERGYYEIIQATDPLAGLKAEREALLKRLAEIDNLLSTEDAEEAENPSRIIRMQ